MTTKITHPIIHQSDIVDRLGEKLNNLPLEDIRQGVHCIIHCLQDALLNNQTIAIRGFGTFTCKQYPERTFYHPKKGVHKTLKPRSVARFKMGKMLQQQLNSAEKDK